MSKRKTSPILDAVHETARGLHDAGVMSETTMREFDALCLPPVKKYTAVEIKRIRSRHNVSQPVFAAYLNVTKSTVAQWETGREKTTGSIPKAIGIGGSEGSHGADVKRPHLYFLIRSIGRGLSCVYLGNLG